MSEGSAQSLGRRRNETTHSILADTDAQRILEVVELHRLHNRLLFPLVLIIPVPYFRNAIGSIPEHQIAPPSDIETSAEEGGERMTRVGGCGVGGEEGSPI